MLPRDTGRHKTFAGSAGQNTPPLPVLGRASPGPGTFEKDIDPEFHSMTTYNLIAAFIGLAPAYRTRRPGPLGRLVRHIRHMRQYDYLSQQPNRILDDVGVTRADIDARRGGFWR